MSYFMTDEQELLKQAVADFCQFPAAQAAIEADRAKGGSPCQCWDLLAQNGECGISTCDFAQTSPSSRMLLNAMARRVLSRGFFRDLVAQGTRRLEIWNLRERISIPGGSIWLAATFPDLPFGLRRSWIYHPESGADSRPAFDFPGRILPFAGIPWSGVAPMFWGGIVRGL